MPDPPDQLDRLKSVLADRYRFEGVLGEDGMATVYTAVDVRHDRRVAVKVLKRELAAVIGSERFLLEMRVTAHLQHPHILAKVLDFLPGARATKPRIPHHRRVVLTVGRFLTIHATHRNGVIGLWR